MIKIHRAKGGYLIHGDCIKVMKRMKPKSVDLVICSPPYEDARLYLEDGQDLGIALNTEEWCDWMIKVVEASLRVCKGLCAFVVGHGKGARKWSGAPALLEADLIRKGICLRRTLYYKRNGFMGSGGNDYMRADVERIIVAANDDKKLEWSDNTACGAPWKFRKGGEISHYNKDGTRVNSKKRLNRPTSVGRFKDGTKKTKTTAVGKDYDPPELANPGDVIDVGAVGGGHMGSNIAHENEAAYSVEVPRFFVKSFCKPGGLVLDPFGGSGTTLQAAMENGRRFVCIDLRRSQIKLMQRRVVQTRNNMGLFAP